MELVEYLRALIGDQTLTLTEEEPAFRFALEDYLGWTEKTKESDEGQEGEGR